MDRESSNERPNVYVCFADEIRWARSFRWYSVLDRLRCCEPAFQRSRDDQKVDATADHERIVLNFKVGAVITALDQGMVNGNRDLFIRVVQIRISRC